MYLPRHEVGSGGHQGAGSAEGTVLLSGSLPLVFLMAESKRKFSGTEVGAALSCLHLQQRLRGHLESGSLIPSAGCSLGQVASVCLYYVFLNFCVAVVVLLAVPLQPSDTQSLHQGRVNG